MKLKRFMFYINLLILSISALIYLLFDTSYVSIEVKFPNSKAKCLDGSNYKFLFSKGFENGTSSFYVYFESGGFCGDNNFNPNNDSSPLESCLNKFGTRQVSNNFSIFRYFSKFFERYFTSTKYFNPLFYNWNKVFIKYCDGTFHLGNVENTIKYKGKNMYIRGEENVKSVFDFLVKYKNFSTAKNVVVAGTSSGGIASVFYSKYIRSLFNNSYNVNYKVISDSGYFVAKNYSLIYDNINIMEQMISKLINNFNIVKTQTMIKYYENSLNFMDFIFPKKYLNSFNKDFDILFLTSQYDSWGLRRLIGTQCFFNNKIYNSCNEKEKIMFKKYGEDVIDEIKEMVKEDKDKKITAWINNGFFHSFLLFNWNLRSKKMGINNMSLEEFIIKWYYGILPNEKKIFYNDKEIKNSKDAYWMINYYGEYLEKMLNIKIVY